MSILDRTFKYFPGDIEITKPMGEVSLRRFIESHKDPSPKIKEVFNQIAEAERVGNMELKAKLKQNNLFFFCPCAVVEGRRAYDCITKFTGLLVLDFDHMDDAAEFRDEMFDRMKSIVVAYLSPSRRGVKFIIKIPVVDSVDEFKSYFYGIANVMQRFKAFDGTAQNPVLPLFLSWDPGIRYREDPEAWIKQGIKPDEFEAYEGDYEILENVTEEERNKVLHIIKVMLGKAETENNGHGNVRAAGLVMGGYIAKGYLSQEDGENEICRMISEVPYLQKNTRGYCRTAKEMINRGMAAPLELS